MTATDRHNSPSAFAHIELPHVDPFPDHQSPERAPKVLLETHEESALLFALGVRIDYGLLDQLPQPCAPASRCRQIARSGRVSEVGTRRTREGLSRQSVPFSSVPRGLSDGQQCTETERALTRTTVPWIISPSRSRNSTVSPTRSSDACRASRARYSSRTRVDTSLSSSEERSRRTVRHSTRATELDQSDTELEVPGSSNRRDRSVTELPPPIPASPDQWEPWRCATRPDRSLQDSPALM
jgi:hypothetical protein